jgi:hypothetical protein
MRNIRSGAEPGFVLLGGRYKHIAFKTYGGKTKRSYFHIGGQNQKKTFGGMKN